MASGNFDLNNTSGSAYVRVWIEWSSVGNVYGLYSDVTATMYARRTNTGYTTYGQGSWGITIDGEWFGGSGNYSWTSSTTTVISETKRIYHTNGVNKSITISGSWNGNSPTSGSGSGTAQLGTLTQYAPGSPSSVSTSLSVVAYNTTNFTLSWSGASVTTFAVYTHRIYYSLGSGWVKLKDVEVSKNATSGSATISLSGITSTRGKRVRFAVSLIDSVGKESSGRPETNVTLANEPTAPSTVNVSASIVPQTTTNFTLSWSGASAGSGSITAYRIYYKTSSSAGWTILRDVAGTSTNLSLSGITNTRGTIVYYTVGVINSYGLLKQATATRTVQLANMATIATSIQVSNYKPKKSENITISWSGATAGSGTIQHYSVDVRRNSNGVWSEWYNQASPTTTSYTWDIDETYTDLKPNDILQIRIGTRNSYGLTAGTWKFANDVIVNGGVVRLNVNGVWKQGQVYINVNGVWKEATSIYENVSGVWKEGV